MLMCCEMGQISYGRGRPHATEVDKCIQGSFIHHERVDVREDRAQEGEYLEALSIEITPVGNGAFV